MLERALSVALRTSHLLAVVWLGAGVLGAPAFVVGTGLALAVIDLLARRISLRELAGAVVLVKLVLSAWMGWQPQHAGWLLVVIVVVSSLAAHAPKPVRHWRPGGRDGHPAGAGRGSGRGAPRS